MGTNFFLRVNFSRATLPTKKNGKRALLGDLVGVAPFVGIAHIGRGVYLDAGFPLRRAGI